jgi:hypothetical protein
MQNAPGAARWSACYANGEGVGKDDVAAWFKAAAEQEAQDA